MADQMARLKKRHNRAKSRLPGPGVSPVRPYDPVRHFQSCISRRPWLGPSLKYPEYTIKTHLADIRAYFRFIYPKSLNYAIETGNRLKRI